MKRSFSRAAFAVLTTIAATAAFACGDDDYVARERLDGGSFRPGDGGDGGSTLPCGVTVPTTYESPAFATNARVELDLRADYLALDAKMRSGEGADSVVVTAAELRGLYASGTPSLRAVSSGPSQTMVDTYFDAFGAAVGKIWKPADAEQDGGAASGGEYAARLGDGGPGTDGFLVDAVGTDLREATNETILAGAFYNHVLGIVASPVNEAAVDRLVAALGASPRFANQADPDAGADPDVLIAAHASRRDDKASSTPGLYRRLKSSLLTAKASAAAGDKCKKELDDAIASYLLDWEKTAFASAIFHLDEARKKAVAVDGPGALHAFGAAIGFIQSYKGIAQEKRKISDAQIDALLTKVGAATPYRLVGDPGSGATKIDSAVSDIAAIYGFSAAEVDGFKR